jgi:hypothetical protein
VSKSSVITVTFLNNCQLSQGAAFIVAEQIERLSNPDLGAAIKRVLLVEDARDSLFHR